MMTRPLGRPSLARSRFLAVLLVVLALGSCAGIVVGALHGSILGVVLAALLPGFCIVAIRSTETR